MTTENAIYQYEPLTNRHEIRVLYLTSGGSDEPLSGHLRLEQLGAVSYEALSYEWGNAEKNHIFHIHDGRTLRITESLHNALRDLRRGPPRSQAPRATWADGICINQDDISERGQQVALMGEIYSTASRVITYIGPERDRSGLAIEFARQLRDRAEPGMDSSSLPPLSDHRWPALRSLLLRSWPSRCWCALEFLLNSRLIVMCGRVELLDWDLLPSIIDLAFARWLPVQLLPGPAEDPRALAECLSHLDFLRHSVVNQGLRISLSELLQNFHPFLASDPRDKIYSVLGLAHDAESLTIPLDYNLPVEQLYITTACQIFGSSQDIGLLYHNLDKKAFHLPSWVPDWSTWVYGSLGIAFDASYKASGETVTNIQVYPSEEKIELAGCLVDRISKLSSPIGPHYHKFNGDSAAGRIRWLREQEAFVQALKPYPNGSALTDVLWRTLIGDLTLQKQRATDSYKQLFEAHLQRSENGPEYNESMAREFVDSVRRKSRSRVLATTNRGYLGAIPETTKPGDWICMFHGAHQLFVIREGPRGFAYVGSAYVHGLMYGEILEADWYAECVISLI